MADHEPLTDLACGDPELSTEVREALTLLRERSDDEEFRELVEDVLTGRCSLFDASGTAAFGTAIFGRIADEFGENVERMTEVQGHAATVPGTAPHGPCGRLCGGCLSPCATPPQ